MKYRSTYSVPISLRTNPNTNHSILFADFPKHKDTKEYLVNIIITNSFAPIMNKTKTKNNFNVCRLYSLPKISKDHLFTNTMKTQKPYALPVSKPQSEIIGQKFFYLNHQFNQASNLSKYTSNIGNDMVRIYSNRSIKMKSSHSLFHSYKQTIEHLHKRLNRIKINNNYQ